MPKAIVVNATTGATEERELTEAETGQMATRGAEERANRDERERAQETRKAARQALKAVKRGNAPMNPAQLTDAVRQILALLDVD